MAKKVFNLVSGGFILRTTQIMNEETSWCFFKGYSFQSKTMDLFYAPPHRQDCTYHGLCYTSCQALTEMRNSSMDSSIGIVWSVSPQHHEWATIKSSKYQDHLTYWSIYFWVSIYAFPISYHRLWLLTSMYINMVPSNYYTQTWQVVDVSSVKQKVPIDRITQRR